MKIDSKCYPVYKGVNTIGRNKMAVVDVKNLVGSLAFIKYFIKQNMFLECKSEPGSTDTS